MLDSGPSRILSEFGYRRAVPAEIEGRRSRLPICRWGGLPSNGTKRDDQIMPTVPTDENPTFGTARKQIFGFDAILLTLTDTSTY